MAHLIKPPTPLPADFGASSVFLAGSIEMGAAEDWQQQVEAALQDLPVVMLNPRRDEWDASWVQSIRNSASKWNGSWRHKSGRA